jgi:hypothetical protein
LSSIRSTTSARLLVLFGANPIISSPVGRERHFLVFLFHQVY